MIDYDGANIPDVGVDGVSEQQQLNDGRNKDHSPHARIPKHLPELLAKDLEHATP
jgi:hypothetical protein